MAKAGVKLSFSFRPLFFGNVLAHQPFGQALMNAKQDFFRQCAAANLFDETAQKTLLEFVLYGDPSLKV